jgi:hypothetical protein
VRFHFMADLSELEDYHSSLRVDAVNIIKPNIGKLLSIQTCTRSRIVSMGVAVANLALGGILKNYSDKASFDAEVRHVSKAPPE